MQEIPPGVLEVFVVSGLFITGIYDHDLHSIGAAITVQRPVTHPVLVGLEYLGLGHE